MKTKIKTQALWACLLIGLALLLSQWSGSAGGLRRDAAGGGAGPEAGAAAPLVTGDGGGLSLVRTAGALLVVAGILAAIALLARRYGHLLGKGRAAGGRLRILEKHPAGEKSQLLLLEWEGAQYLVGQSGAGFQMLDRRRRPKTEPAADPAVPEGAAVRGAGAIFPRGLIKALHLPDGDGAVSGFASRAKGRPS